MVGTIGFDNCPVGEENTQDGGEKGGVLLTVPDGTDAAMGSMEGLCAKYT
jgi:hypothetical protein